MFKVNPKPEPWTWGFRCFGFRRRSATTAGYGVGFTEMLKLWELRRPDSKKLRGFRSRSFGILIWEFRGLGLGN